MTISERNDSQLDQYLFKIWTLSAETDLRKVAPIMRHYMLSSLVGNKLNFVKSVNTLKARF